MISRTIKVEPATSEGLAPFGSLIATSGWTPDASFPAFNFWNCLGLADMKGTPSLCMVESFDGAVQESTIFERHGGTTETLIPVDGDIVVVLAHDATGCYDMIEEESVRAFRIAQGNAVILNAGTWHYAPIACGRTTRTFILFDRDTPGIDVTVIDTGETLGVSWVLEH